MVWVLKLGGSLFKAAELSAWLAALAEVGAGQVVIVPGGGPFADQVRSAQQRWDFDDATAHRMAVLAMEQYGLMLAGLEPRLTPAAAAAALLQGLERGKAMLWLPARMLADHPELPAAWDLSS